MYVQLLDDKPPDQSDQPIAESTPKKGDKPSSADVDANQSNGSEMSGYATANQSMEGSPAVVQVGQLIDIPLQDTSSEVCLLPINAYFIADYFHLQCSPQKPI